MISYTSASDKGSVQHTVCLGSGTQLVPMFCKQFADKDICRIYYLWCTNVLPCSPDTSSFCSTLSIDTTIPSIFNQILDLKDVWKTVAKVLRAWSFCRDNVRCEHLDVPITTETTWTCQIPLNRYTCTVTGDVETNSPSCFNLEICCTAGRQT